MVAALYGAPAPGAAGARVELNPAQRAGLLTHASFLATHANPNQSSPVQRGVIVRKNLLCQPLPDPPPDVSNAPPEPKPGATTRERFAEHQKNPSCGACHALIDDIGLGFESYDGVGAFRAVENGKPVDATGTMRSSDLDGTFNGAVELSKRLAGSRQVHECVARQWFGFALGRLDSEADECSLRRLYDAFAASGGDVRALLGAVVTTDSFRYRRLRPEAGRTP